MFVLSYHANISADAILCEKYACFTSQGSYFSVPLKKVHARINSVFAETVFQFYTLNERCHAIPQCSAADSICYVIF